MLRLLSAAIALLSVLVPRHRRGRWREEWRGELRGIASEAGRAPALQFAAGMLRDAITVRRLPSPPYDQGPRQMTTQFSWMDLKLALRMLRRSPGLTIVSVFGMAVTIGIVAGASTMISRQLNPRLPLADGDRVVAIQTWDAAANTDERRVLHDFALWRRQLKSVQDVGAFRDVPRNLILEGRAPESILIAEASAAAFRVAAVSPLLGRYLSDEDEQLAAPAVVVIGAPIWRDKFRADPAILGTSVQLNDTHHTIVGVMPDGFAFPVNHRWWTPLRVDEARSARRQGPPLIVFGRLADHATMQSAEAEISTMGRAASATFPSTHEHLRPRILPYTHLFGSLDRPENVFGLQLVRFLLVLLLIVVSVNVAVLVYARTATRQGEIAIRTALGASRIRIVSQLFVEALMLSAVAAVIGLGILWVFLVHVRGAMAHELPFWFRVDVSTGTVFYVLALMLMGAGLIGVIPALKATGRRVQSRLQTISAGAGSGLQLGGTWTLLIVLQMAFAVALLPWSVVKVSELVKSGTAHPGFAADEVLTAYLSMESPTGAPALNDGAAAALNLQFGGKLAEVTRQLEGEPTVAGVAFATALPGGERTAFFEVASSAAPDSVSIGQAPQGARTIPEVRTNHVTPNLFDVFGIPILTGRAFNAADGGPASTAVIVNRSFVEKLSGDAPAVGRRVRYAQRGPQASGPNPEQERWLEIVGVISDFPSITNARSGTAGIYHATLPAQLESAVMAVRMRGTTGEDVAGRVREVAARVDPNLQVQVAGVLGSVIRAEQKTIRLLATAVGVVTLSVIFLSAAGVYAMMSFAVAQRRREIGIRAALGADRRRILGSIFSRAALQLAAGAVLGLGLATFMESLTGGEMMQGRAAAILPLVAVVMTLVGACAAFVPARRSLAVGPIEALRDNR